MKRLKKMLILIAPPILAACQSPPAQPPHGNFPPHGGQMHYGGRYQCENGMEVAVNRESGDRVRLTVSGDGDPGSKTVIMTRSASGNSGHYVTNSGLYGGGGQWRGNGREGYFDYKRYDGQPVSVRCSQ